MDLNIYLSSVETGTSLAGRLGVPDALLSQWKTGARQVPAERCPDIERETGGRVRCEELRPDLSSQFSYIRSTRQAA